jgi:hypothetical protein
MKLERTKFLITCLIFFTLGFNLVLPFFTKQEPVSAQVIGYNGTGDTWVSMVTGRVRATRGTVTNDGTFYYGYAYMQRVSGSPKAKLAIYDHEYNYLGVSNELSIDTAQWYNFSFGAGISTNAGENYYVASFASDGTACQIRYDSTSGTLYYQSGLTYPNFPNPASWTTYSPQNLLLYAVSVDSYVKSWKNVATGYFRFSNSSSFKSASSGYFTLLNSSSFDDVSSGYFSLQNSASVQSISTGYFSLSNTSSFKTTASGWFLFQNTASLQDISSGYFTFNNGVSWQSLTLWKETLYHSFESYSSRTSFWGNNWRGQSFTPTTTHSLSHIAFYGGRYRNPGTIYYGIKATTGGKPTGGWLVTGTFDSSVLPDRQIGESPIWVDLYFTTPLTVNSGTMYAMIFYTTSNSSNWVDIYYDAGSYAGGTYLASSNSGSTWTTASFDHAFREYGLASIGTSGYFVFSNTGAFQSVTSGYVSFRNTSTYKTLYDGWFTFQNVTTGWQTVSSGWFRLSNVATMHTALSGYVSFYNASSYKTALEGYFLFSSGVQWDTPAEGYFSFQNTSILTTITSGWFNLSNVSSIKTVEEGWFSFAHVPLWRNIDYGYFRFINYSSWKLLDSGWFRFENMSNASPIPRIILPHPGETVRYNTPFLVTYSVYSSKKEPVNVSLQVIYLGVSQWINLTNQALNSDEYYLNSTIDISLAMAALGITADYNSPYVLNLNATNYVTHLSADTQSNFRLRDSTYDMVILFFPLIILILFSILAFWKQSKIILTATITTAILYATMLATSFAGTIDSMYVVLLIVYALALSTMYFFWKKSSPKK